VEDASGRVTAATSGEAMATVKVAVEGGELTAAIARPDLVASIAQLGVDAKISIINVVRYETDGSLAVLVGFNAPPPRSPDR